jgi:hypothetical protein
MQFQLPQFIETEDKVVGPFTIKQFLYIAAAGVLGFILYFTVQPWLFVLLSVIFLSIAFGFAFLKVEGRSLPHVFISALSFYWKPQTYVWQPEHPGVEKEKALGGGISLEDIVSGAALHSAWKNLQTGLSPSSPKKELEKGERYQIFQRQSGERRGARRIDYR